ncbi:MAG: polysaccharide pyruvyl transferase family protein [Thermoanaerobacteraceae bacterium]|nr:polysaccharide pyruvyl transferase family protein [Thermoanaerobacteraceae bacterium]
MKKAGIITFHCADNFGAVLQTFALSKVLENFGLSAEVIDFLPKEITNLYTLFPDIRYTLNQQGYSSALKAILYRILHCRKIKTRISNFGKFREKYLNLSESSFLTADELLKEKPKYDYYITGSDQVWNPDLFSKIGGSYFLDFAPDNSIKISYAASIAKKVEPEFEPFFEQHLKRFDYISVREKSSKGFVSKFTDKEVWVTLDPTLLIDDKDWESICDFGNKYDEEYIFVYDLVKAPEIVSLANRIAKRFNCKIISFSGGKGYINWHSRFSTASPTDFLGLMRNAKFVLSTSFHGTAFAIIFNKPFYTVPHPTRGSRMTDLLNSLGLNERLVKSIDDPGIIDDIDYAKANRNLACLKQKSLEFLRTALEIA